MYISIQSQCVISSEYFVDALYFLQYKKNNFSFLSRHLSV